MIPEKSEEAGHSNKEGIPEQLGACYYITVQDPAMASTIKLPERITDKNIFFFLTPRHDNDVNQAEWTEHF